MKYLLYILCTVLGAFIGMFLSWGLMFVAAPNMSIDTAWNVIVVCLLLGAAVGFYAYHRRLKRST